ncbi:MAG: NUDIX domain-containing protein [Treponema sp.]|nr:NUDIX domain-containing protein [Treponema sp.]
MSFTNDFKVCPMCGSSKINNINNRKWLCPDCGFDLYNNVAAAVGIILADNDGNILFEKRAKEPRCGYFALPGGFVNPDESLEEAAVRECFEETGIKPESVSYLCSFPNTYEYKNITYKTCDSFFTARIPEGTDSIELLMQQLHGQQSEVLGFVSVHAGGRNDIDGIPLAFGSAEKALECWLENYKRKQ